MTQADTLALLREALEFLNDHPNFGLRRDPRQTSYKLAARIDHHLAITAPTITNHAAVAVARVRWAESASVRIDADELETRSDVEGHWVRAWVHVAADWLPIDSEPPIAIDPAVYRAAVMGLPPITRTIFLLHRADGLSYGAIADRTGLPTETVEQQIARALVLLGRNLRPDDPIS